MNPEQIGIGAIGAGGFGLFALQQFLQVPGTSLEAMAGTHKEAAMAMARRFNVLDIKEVDTLLAMPEVNLVYIATPPFLHYPQARAALEAGKHVVCEKPLSLTVEEAATLVGIANERNLLCATNLMQRYNPLYEAVRLLVESKILGECLHGELDNFAGDEGLGEDHWFWDPTKSGGIFIEHGVHFFDVFEGWLGPGEVVAAQRVLRPGSGLEEQVQCTVRHANGLLVNHYHSFTQTGRLDRQEFRLLFERGDVSLEEWVPVRARIRAVVNEEQTRQIMEIFPGARLDTLKVYGGSGRSARGRHKDIDISQQIDVSFGLGDDKMRRYSELLRSFFTDQVSWIRQPSHRRQITESNGVNSLILAAEATRLAAQSK